MIDTLQDRINSDIIQEVDSQKAHRGKKAGKAKNRMTACSEASYKAYTKPQRAVRRMTMNKASKRQARYDATHTMQVKLKLNLETDADIIEVLQKVENKQGYIKDLIRNDYIKELRKKEKASR